MNELEVAEAALAESWDDDHLAIYGDALLGRGDPRGELIAIDLHVKRHGARDELAAHKRRLIDTWLGEAVAVRVLEIADIELGFVNIKWPLVADELEGMFAGPIGPYMRTLMVEDHDPKLRRVVDLICQARWPWLTRLDLCRYSDAFDPLLHDATAIDDDRARAFAAATPGLHQLVVAGANMFGDLAHPTVRELVVYDYDAIASLRQDGAPFSSLTTLDLQLCSAPSAVDLEALLPAARFPALRRLDLSRNELNRDQTFELVQRLPLVSQLAWLCTPSLRSDAHLETIELAAARMRTDAELVVARAYTGYTSRSPSPRITMPPARPWPPRDAVRGYDVLLVSIAGERYLDGAQLSDVIGTLEKAFDALAEPARAAWIELWPLIRPLEPEDHGSPQRPMPCSAELLARALEPLDLADHRAWAELRTALGQRTGDALMIRRAWSIFA